MSLRRARCVAEPLSRSAAAADTAVARAGGRRRLVALRLRPRSVDARWPSPHATSTWRTLERRLADARRQGRARRRDARVQRHARPARTVDRRDATVQHGARARAAHAARGSARRDRAGAQRHAAIAGLQQSLASQIEDIDRLTRLIDHVLTLARAESGQIPLTFVAVDLGELASLAGRPARAGRARPRDRLAVRAGHRPSSRAVMPAGWNGCCSTCSTTR